LQSAGTTAVTIDTSQNVGIGTTSPNLGGLTRALTINTPTGGNYSGLELAGAGTLSARFVTNNVGTYFGSQLAIPLVFETSGAERMRISSAGYVTTPYQPSFLAYRAGGNTAITSGTNTLPLDGTIYNISSSYSTTNTRFTAPVAGTYQFNLTANVYSTPGIMQVNLYVNGTDYISGTRLSSTINGDNNISMSTALYLNVNDYVVPRIYIASNSSISSGVFWNNFSGYLVG
jgi:hypothetical protein